MGRLSGKFILITGAGQGIGRRTAELCLQENAAVIAADINQEALNSLVSEQEKLHCGRLHSLSLDVTNREEIERAASLWADRVDVLFNCAGGVLHHGGLSTATDQLWSDSHLLNVTSVFWMCRAFAPAMRRRRSGSIINMSSVAGQRGVVDRLIYGTMKAAVAGFTRSLAAELVKDSVRCNCICPGTVDTPSWRQRVASSSDPDAALGAFIARQPMGRVGKPDEIAWLVVYLASDESSYTTGSTIMVDGGWTM